MLRCLPATLHGPREFSGREANGNQANYWANRGRLLLAMQAFFGHWAVYLPAHVSLRKMLPSALLIALALGTSVGAQTPRPTPPHAKPARPSQGQAANQFLRAILRADYAWAYARLAPEVRRAVSLGGFEAAARPLWKSGQPRRQAIELYKLGMRLDDGGNSRLFYAFSFAADSALKMPPVLLEVTFRDTASRAILGFGLRPNKAGPSSKRKR